MRNTTSKPSASRSAKRRTVGGKPVRKKCLDENTVDRPQIKITSIRGIQSRREFYTCMLPVELIARLVVTGNETWEADTVEIPATLRKQRQLNKARANKIASYIVENPSEYVLPSLVCSIVLHADAPDPKFVPHDAESSGSSGVLMLDAQAKFLVNDGQHRCAGIVEAIRRIRSLISEKRSRKDAHALEMFLGSHIPVTLFWDAGLARAQQIFADINRNAVKPSAAISLTFDHRDPIASLCRKVEQDVPELRNRIEWERSSVSAKSGKLFAINSLHKAVGYLLENWDPAGKLDDPTIEKVVGFFVNLCRGMPLYSVGRRLSEIREQSLAVQGIAIEAIALAFSTQENYLDRIGRLDGVDFSRGRKVWGEVGVMHGERIVKNAKAVRAMAAVIVQETRTPPANR